MWIQCDDKNGTPERAQVIRTFTKPEDLPSEERAKGFITEAVPEFKSIPGKMGIMYGSTASKSVWIEYIDKPLDDPEVLVIRTANIEIALANIMGL